MTAVNQLPTLPESSKVTPITYVLDGSGSMIDPTKPDLPASESKMAGMLRGLEKGLDYCRQHPTLRNSAMLALTTISETPVTMPFESIQRFISPSLVPDGGTPLGGALHRSVDGLAEYLHSLNGQGRTWHTPTMAIVSDGQPNLEPARYREEAIERVRSLVVARQLFVIAIGVTKEDAARLEALQICHQAVSVEELAWAEVFRIVSASAGQLAQGQKPLPSAGHQP